MHVGAGYAGDGLARYTASLAIVAEAAPTCLAPYI